MPPSGGFGGSSLGHPETVACATCQHFAERRGERPDGWCTRYGAEAWARVQFHCDGHVETSPQAAAGESRRRKIERELAEHPEKRVAFDVIDAPIQESATAATATPATNATNTPRGGLGVANVAAVAVAAEPAPSAPALPEAVWDPPDEVTAAREARQARVEAKLLAHPELRRAFDVVDAPLTFGPGEPVSVVLAVRCGEQILSGEVLVPRERWDLRAFLAVMEAPELQQ